MDPFISQVILMANTFAPAHYAVAQGQIEQIGQNTALFSLLGTLYGGDGRITYGLPDLRGRVPIGWGTTPWQQYDVGNKGGYPKQSVYMNLSQLPAHTHEAVFTPTGGGSGSPLEVQIAVSNDTTGNSKTPNGNYISKFKDSANNIVEAFDTEPTADAYLNGVSVSGGGGGITGGTVTVGSTGGSNPMDIPTMPPYLTMNYAIALQGTYPPRS